MLISEYRISKRMLLMNLDPMTVKEYADIFGIEHEKFLVYLTVLQHQPVTAAQVSKKLDFDRGRTYRSIDKLESLGFVSRTESNPCKVLAIDPNEVLGLIVTKHENMIKDIKNRKIDDLVSNIGFNANKNTKIASSYISGQDNFFARLITMVGDSEKITMYLSQETLKKIYYTKFPEIACKKKKLKIFANDSRMVRRLKCKDYSERFPELDYDVIVADNNVLIKVGSMSRTTYQTNFDVGEDNYLYSGNRILISIASQYLKSLDRK